MKTCDAMIQVGPFATPSDPSVPCGAPLFDGRTRCAAHAGWINAAQTAQDAIWARISEDLAAAGYADAERAS